MRDGAPEESTAQARGRQLGHTWTLNSYLSARLEDAPGWIHPDRLTPGELPDELHAWVLNQPGMRALLTAHPDAEEDFWFGFLEGVQLAMVVIEVTQRAT
jgi:hypothetical protein